MMDRTIILIDMIDPNESDAHVQINPSPEQLVWIGINIARQKAGLCPLLKGDFDRVWGLIEAWSRMGIAP